MNTSTTPWDAVIVGGGAAGLSAALILARARRRVLVLDGGEPRNRFAPHMHGVLSRNGYSPLDLVADGRREVREADGVIETANVVSAAQIGDGFELTTDAGDRIRTRRLVVATGIRDEMPAVPGLAEQWGRGVVACPYCDGYESRGKRVGVLLGSAAGAHKAHLIRAYTDEVTLLTSLAGELPEEDRRVFEARGIRIDDRQVTAVTSEANVLTGVQFADGSTLALDTIFADPRMVPLDSLLRQLDVAQTESPFGFWTTVDAAFQTSVPGVFAIGNVANPSALVPIASAAGVTAAVTINAELVAADIAATVAAMGVAS